MCSDTGFGESLYLLINVFVFIYLVGKSTAPLLGGGRRARREAHRKSERVDLNSSGLARQIDEHKYVNQQIQRFPKTRI